jgi:hypothetical protein
MNSITNAQPLFMIAVPVVLTSGIAVALCVVFNRRFAALRAETLACLDAIIGSSSRSGE